MKPIESVADAEARTYKALATDDRKAGEGTWYFVVQSDRSKIAGFPPPGTHESTLRAVIESVGGGHIDTAEVDPYEPGDRRRAIMFDALFQPPGACEECRGARPGPDALAETTDGEPPTDDILPTPKPAGPAGPGAGPPPAQGGD